MTATLRIALVLSAAVVLAFVVRKIRRSQLSATGSIYWLLLSLGLVVVAVFPQVAFFFSGLLGFQSPSNFVFLAVIALLLIRQFSLQTQITQLQTKLAALVQEVALRDARDAAPGRRGDGTR